jgi:archaellum component FlaC
MKDKVKCWEVFECDETECPVYQKKELKCWLIQGTHCRNEIQGKFLEKMEMCLQCEPFRANMDVDSMEETLTLVNVQFTSFRQMVEERDRELEDVSMELALGLSEVFGALKEISSGDPEVRIPETSTLELITKLKHMVNLTASSLAELVDLSHEFAIGLAEHFGVLDSVSKGNLAARVSGTSQVELLEALKEVTNQMIENVSTEIAERKQAEEALQRQSHDLSERVKDLNCLYAISKLVMTPGISFDNLFQEIVNLIPGSWHQAGIVCARIVLESQEFRTENFRETVWKQTSDITANGKKVGTLEVCYLKIGNS